jgi:ketosteroid isomerase-like protein
MHGRVLGCFRCRSRQILLIYGIHFQQGGDMRRLIMVLTVLGGLVALGCEPPASNTANNANRANAVNNANVAAVAANAEAEVKKAMEDMAKDIASNNADALAVRYADDYYLVTPQGTLQTKADRLADVKSGNTKFESFAYEDVKVRQYGNTAVATATVRAKGKAEGKDVAPQIRATLVFVKTGDQWKVVSGQATAVQGGQTGAANSNTSNANTGNTNAAKASPSPANK